EVKSQGFLSRSINGFFLGGMAERYQNFQSTTPGDVIKISHAPSLDLSSVDRPLWNLPLHWSLDASAAGLARSEPGFRTGNLLARFDVHPEVSLPLLLKGWSIRPGIALHDTYYTERLVPGEQGPTAQNDPINRTALEATLEIRPPALERVFDREFLGRKWKHVIEPRVLYRHTGGVGNFSNILRFDERDILSNTHEVEYGFVTRLYAKRTNTQIEECVDGMTGLAVGGAAPEQNVPWERTDVLLNQECQLGPQVHEIATWELS